MAKPPKKSKTFNLLDPDTNVVTDVRDSQYKLSELREKQNKPTNLCTLDQIRRTSIPIPHFYLQYALGMRYIPSRCIIDVIGAEGIGKTTLALWFMGHAATSNILSYLQGTESKPMMKDQVLRCLSRDRLLAQSILKQAVAYEEVREIRQSIGKIEEFVYDVRGDSRVNKDPRIPSELPIIIGVDTLSKLMAPNQAEGYLDYGENLKAEVAKNLREVGEGSNLQHAKLFQDWSRRLAYFMDEYNILLWLNNHQNAKIDMGGGASYMSAEQSALFNKTKIGGNAFNQSAAVQLIIGATAMVKDSTGLPVGRTIKLRVNKNSYGPDNRTIQYELRNVYRDDTDTSQECPLNFDNDMAKWMADNKYLNTAADKKRYTCEMLGVVGAEARELSEALHANVPIMTQLARQVGISGYDDPIEKIIKETDGKTTNPSETV